MLPWEILGEAIDALASERGISVNVYQAPAASIAAPGIVIRPDAPWMQAAGDQQPFGNMAERYALVCVVSSNDPLSNIADLRELVRLARDAADGVRAFRWVDTSGVTSSEADGVEYLATIVRATYSAED